MIKKLTLSAAAAIAAFTALPAAAEAQYYDGSRYERSYRGDRHYDRGYQQNHYGNRYPDRGYQQSYYGDRYQNGGYQQSYQGDRYYGRSDRGYADYDRRCSGTTGTIVGGAAGALIGRALDGGRSRTTGTIGGGVVGALLGREVGKNSCRR
jgi:hypothetical protein